jgi:hypothetical protein
MSILFWLPFLIPIAGIALLLYFFIEKQKTEEKEDFEKRDH